MNKIITVAKREFLSRVQKKTFLLTTILLPLLIFSFYALILYFAVGDEDKYELAVVDTPNLFGDQLRSDDDVSFTTVPAALKDSLKSWVEEKKYSGYIHVPENATIVSLPDIEIFTAKNVGFEGRSEIQERIDEVISEQRLLSKNITSADIDSARQKTALRFQSLDGEDQSDDTFRAAWIVGYVGGFLIYIILFIYGTMVMRGVMEEKVSRIAEVIVSSVKPFQLMMGKILGIGTVGLTQFCIWIGIILSLNVVVVQFFPDLIDQMQQTQSIPGTTNASAEVTKQIGSVGVLSSLSTINIPLILFCFIFYFIGGYLLYSALFAAVGSAVNEDPQDAQSLLLPITMPIIFGIVILMKAANEPTSGLSVFGSLFPLTSPIVMMARVAHGIPDGVSLWELILSMILLVAGFLVTTWMAGKIYRTGILMYGKKPSWKEMWKWTLRK
jgi:ABC-2 type transport system permease protein